MSKIIFAFAATTLLYGSAAAQYRPPYDPDTYYHTEDVECRTPWTELTPPSELQSTCIHEDEDGSCSYSYTPQRAWICYDHHRDWYGPDGIITMQVGKDAYMIAGLGKGHAPFEETLPGWNRPQGLATSVSYRDEIVTQVIDPCFVQVIQNVRLDETMGGTADALYLMKVLQASAVDDMINAVAPMVAGKDDNTRKALYAVFLTQCISAMVQG